MKAVAGTENRKKQQDENAMAITRTGDDRFRPIRTPDTMKKVAATSGQRVNLAIAFFAWEALGKELCGERYSAQFFLSSSLE